MQDIYSMPTTQRKKYLDICEAGNKYELYCMEESKEGKDPLPFSDWKRKYHNNN